MGEFDSSKEVLAWLMAGGGIALFSLIAERWVWFQGLTQEAKKYLSNLAVAGIALIAFIVYASVPEAVFVEIDPYIKLFVTIVGSVGFKEVWHKLVNKK